MLTIGQFSKASQIPSKTLRYYDEINLLKPSFVDTQNGYRYYEASQLDMTMKILRLKQFEFSLSEIQIILEDNEKLTQMLDEKKKEIQFKVTDYTNLQTTIENYIRELSQGGSIMGKIDTSKIKVVTSPSLNLISVRETINIANFDRLFEKAGNLLGLSQQVPTGCPVTLYHSDEYTPENYDVEVGFPIADPTISNHIIEPAECAYFEYVGLYDNLGEAYLKLTKWIEENGYKINGVPYEQYMTDPLQTEPDKNQVNVYMPIIKEN